MKPSSPFTQSFDQLPDILPLYAIENALLPGGELPLELQSPQELQLFQQALKSDQLIGMVQPQAAGGVHGIGCAGRIRQYRERKDGRLNVMLSGICRYRIERDWLEEPGFRCAAVNWQAFAQDYQTAVVEAHKINRFKERLKHYFETHRMQVDWPLLEKQEIEKVVNNLVLIMHFNRAQKQQLLEAQTVTQRMSVFEDCLEAIPTPITVPTGDAEGRLN